MTHFHLAVGSNDERGGDPAFGYLLAGSGDITNLRAVIVCSGGEPEQMTGESSSQYR
jgi:hypothetical protein